MRKNVTIAIISILGIMVIAVSIPLLIAGNIFSNIILNFSKGPLVYSPIATEEMVYFGSTDEHIYAVDEETGKLQWRAKTVGWAGYSIDKDLVYIMNGDGNLDIVEAKSGKKRRQVKKDGSPFSSLNYTYNENGLIASISASSEGTTTYEYDGQNRLSKATEPTGKVTIYEFDTAGNRTKMESKASGEDSQTTTYTYDSVTNELDQINKPTETVNFSYDPNGNLTSKVEPSGETTYTYSPENQLAGIKKPNGDRVEFSYDGESRRESKTVNGVTTKYIYDGDLIAAETTEDGTILATYEYDDEGSPVTVTKGSSTYYFHYSGQGDVIALTDSTGAVVATYKYDDWGNVIETTGIINTPFGYRGKFGYVYDKETGLYFLKTRYYDPQTGRFTTKDRFKGFENRPASQNPYTYCENDAVNAVDPFGLAKMDLGFGSFLEIIYKGFRKIVDARVWKWIITLRLTYGGAMLQVALMAATKGFGNLVYAQIAKVAGKAAAQKLGTQIMAWVYTKVAIDNPAKAMSKMVVKPSWLRKKIFRKDPSAPFYLQIGGRKIYTF